MAGSITADLVIPSLADRVGDDYHFSRAGRGVFAEMDRAVGLALARWLFHHTVLCAFARPGSSDDADSGGIRLCGHDSALAFPFPLFITNRHSPGNRVDQA